MCVVQPGISQASQYSLVLQVDSFWILSKYVVWCLVLLFQLQEDADSEYHKKQKENEEMAEEKTAKKRAKRFMQALSNS